MVFIGLLIVVFALFVVSVFVTDPQPTRRQTSATGNEPKKEDSKHAPH